MIGFKVNQAKGFFVDAPRIVSSFSREERKVGSKFGAFVRRGARSSIRTRKRVSRPGEPPTNRTSILRGKSSEQKTGIAFGFYESTRSVVVGPVKTNQVFFNGNGQPVTGTVPQVLEEGGTIQILEVFKWGAWRRADLRSRRRNAGLPTRLRSVRIAARPYMKPAFDKELPKFPQLWRNVLNRAA